MIFPLLHRHHVESANLVTALFVAACVHHNALVAQRGKITLYRAQSNLFAKAFIEKGGIAARILTDDFENAKMPVAQQSDVFDFSNFRLGVYTTEPIRI